MSQAAVAALLAGGGLYVVVKGGGEETKPKYGSKVHTLANAALGGASHYDGASSGNAPIIASWDAWEATQSGYSTETESEVKKQMQEAWETMSGDAKRAACEKLKSAYPSDSNIQSLNCGSATFQQILDVCALAAGVSVCGPICGGLAVMASEYFGRELSDWAAGAWEDTKDWVEGAWDDTKEWLGDLV